MQLLWDESGDGHVLDSLDVFKNVEVAIMTDWGDTAIHEGDATGETWLGDYFDIVKGRIDPSPLVPPRTGSSTAARDRFDPVRRSPRLQHVRRALTGHARRVMAGDLRRLRVHPCRPDR